MLFIHCLLVQCLRSNSSLSCSSTFKSSRSIINTLPMSGASAYVAREARANAAIGDHFSKRKIAHHEISPVLRKVITSENCSNLPFGCDSARRHSSHSAPPPSQPPHRRPRVPHRDTISRIPRWKTARWQGVPRLTLVLQVVHDGCFQAPNKSPLHSRTFHSCGRLWPREGILVNILSAKEGFEGLTCSKRVENSLSSMLRKIIFIESEE